MLHIKFCTQLNKSHNNIILFIDEVFSITNEIDNVKKLYQLDVLSTLKNCNFDGKFGEVIIIPTDKPNIKNILVVGVGKVNELDHNKFIKLGSKIYLILAISLQILDFLHNTHKL